MCKAVPAILGHEGGAYGPMTSDQTPRLWYSPGACSFAAHITLLEAGLQPELILAQTGKMSEAFNQINPKRKVPVLAVGDQVITEMPAILTCISALRPDRKLLGQNTMESIRAYEWLNYLSGTLHGQGYGGFWRPERFVGDVSNHTAVQEKARQTIKDCYAFIDAKLQQSGTTFSVGDFFTGVDAFLLVFYLWGIRIDIDMDGGYPSYAALARILLQRESVIEARKVHASMC
ncbi:hypothetical protein V8C26DRAFT_171055 [Trichoderma gracile]